MLKRSPGYTEQANESIILMTDLWELEELKSSEVEIKKVVYSESAANTEEVEKPNAECEARDFLFLKKCLKYLTRC